MSKLVEAMIEKYMAMYPNVTREEAYDLWCADMRAKASKGGSKKFPGKGFANPNHDPSAAGKIGGTISRRKKKL